jgi:hypothetical protein
MPLLPLARAQTNSAARESLCEVDALFGDSAVRCDRTALQAAFEKARANGQHEYIRMLEDWVNRQAPVGVQVIGVSFLYDIEQFDADARFCANAANLHRTYKKGDFVPEFRKR